MRILSGMWGWTDIRHTDNVWSDWMKRVLPLGASVCFDVGFVHELGYCSPEQMAQLRRIVALARGKADAETAARHEREMKVIDALKDVELAYGRGCEHPLCLEDRDTDGAEIRAALDKDGAEECVIEYLTSPNPTPKQVFEIIGSGEEASHRVTETQSFLTPIVGVLAAFGCLASLGCPAPQLRISQPQFRSTAGFVSRKEHKERKGFLTGGAAPRPP